jgi:hypothetical protein
MARKSWSFVDPKVGAADVVYFVLVGAYLTLVCGYLLATRRLHAGLGLGHMARRVVRAPIYVVRAPIYAVRKVAGALRWPRRTAGKVVRVLRRPFTRKAA